MSEVDSYIPTSSPTNEVIDSVSNFSDGSCTPSESLTSSQSDKIDVNKSGASSVSKIARPTGLKLPNTVGTAVTSSSRIARLCNNASKPALPTNTESDFLKTGTMSTLSSIGNVREDFVKRRLADVDETDESMPYTDNEMRMQDRKISSGSVLSDSSQKSVSEDLKQNQTLDAFLDSSDSFSDHWNFDTDDVRRTSDTSVVLTENTDQFIIGDRVWVGGVKPGQIAYIGETQFAPGEWAGIVLDEPIGKNDGTVANIRYFQCPPKKGIFSRLTRLTRQPLLDGGAGEPVATRSMISEPKKSNSSFLASVPKKSSMVLTPNTGSKSSISKPTSPDSGINPGLVVGDRVIVKSSQGSKAGLLRYLGTTEFAAGEWCGVELDDPLGKNDGSVAGVRYFECRPKFGLFAPLHKVSKSPANKRLFQPCVVHKSGTSGTRIRRQGSKESLASLSSTTSTNVSVRSTAKKTAARAPTTPTSLKTALQETLKEKEFHIEQLLKERDLERAEVTRAANQADEAERQLAILKQEFEQQKENAEARISDLDAMICLLKSQNDEISNLLEDERKKYEDLQFRFEEETIDKSDIKSSVIKYKEKVELLEKTLAEERKRVEVLEHDSNKLFESEEQMVILKDELDTVKDELQEQKKIRSTLEQEHISLEAHLTSARAGIESLKLENEALKASVVNDESNLKNILETAAQKLEETKKELENKQVEVERLSKELIVKDQNLEEKEKELHAKYLKIMQDLSEKQKADINKISEDYNTNLQSKLKVLDEQLNEKMKYCSSLEAKLNDANILLSKNDAEKTLECNQLKEVNQELENKVKEFSEEMANKNALLEKKTAETEKLDQEMKKIREELEEAKKLFSSSSENSGKEIIALNDIINKQKNELQELKNNAETKFNECNDLNESLTKNNKENLNRIKELEGVLKEKNSELNKSKEVNEKIIKEFEEKRKELEQLHHVQEERFMEKIKNLEESESGKKTEIETLKKNLESTNSLLANEKEILKNEQVNNKTLTDKLTSLEENYQKLLNEKERIELEAGDANRKLQSADEKLNLLTNQKLKLEADISTFINSSNDSSLQLNKLNEDLRISEKTLNSLREELSEKGRKFEHVEQELKLLLDKKDEELKSLKETNIEEKNIANKEIEELKNKIEMSLVASRDIESEWKKKAEVIATDAETKINKLEEDIRNLEKNNWDEKNKYEECINNLKSSQNDLEETLKELQSKSSETIDRLEKEIQELQAERVNLLQTVEKTNVQFLENKKEFDYKVKEREEMLASESEKLRNELKETNEKLSQTMEELCSAKQEKNKLNEEKAAVEKNSEKLEKILEEIQSKNKELVVNVSSVESENKVLKETIDQLREEKCQLDKDLTSKVMALMDLNSQLKNLENSKEVGDTEHTTEIKNLKKEVSELKELLQKTEEAKSSEIINKNKQIENLEKDFKNFKQESSRTMSEKDSTIKNFSEVKERVEKDFNDARIELEKKREQVEKLEKNLQLLRVELDAEKEKCEEFGKKCNASESEKKDLKGKFDEQAKLLVNNSNLTDKLEEATKKLIEAEKREQDFVNHSKIEKEGLQKDLDAKNNLLKLKEKENALLIKECECLKQEKAKWNLKMEEMKQNVEKTTSVNNNPNDSKNSNATGDDEFEKGQIDFLNSVIVDMQKKNDALKARIEILEMGFSPEDAEEFNLHNINTRTVAPRLFCDICEVFDLHDTEDCPTQATEDEPLPPPKSSKTKVPPPERPYCDNCEVFGHDTADCDDGETF